MDNQPLVSVIALNHNQGKFLEEALESIRTQTYKNIELIIVDDYSTDDSRAKINNWIRQNNPNAKLILNDQNLGVTRSSNIGARAATGSYICFNACDDVMQPDKITRLVQEFSHLDSNYMAIYTDAQMIDEEGNLFSQKTFIENHRAFSTPPSGYIFEYLIKGNFFAWPALLMRKEAFEKVGYFDEDLFLEDWDFLLRLSKQYKIQYCPVISAKYRVHSSNYNVGPVRQATFRYDAFRVALKHIDVTYFRRLAKIMLVQFYFRRDTRFVEMLGLYRRSFGSTLLVKLLSFRKPVKVSKAVNLF